MMKKKKKVKTSDNSEGKKPKAEEYPLLKSQYKFCTARPSSVMLHGRHRAKEEVPHSDLLPPPQFKSGQNIKRYILLRNTYKISNHHGYTLRYESWNITIYVQLVSTNPCPWGKKIQSSTIGYLEIILKAELESWYQVRKKTTMILKLSLWQIMKR